MASLAETVNAKYFRAGVLRYHGEPIELVGTSAPGGSPRKISALVEEVEPESPDDRTIYRVQVLAADVPAGIREKDRIIVRDVRCRVSSSTLVAGWYRLGVRP